MNPAARSLTPINVLAAFHRRQPVFTRWAIVYLALAALSLVLATMDARLINGVSVWNKPFKFQLSLGVYFLTLAWFAPLLGQDYFERRQGRVLTWSVVIFAALEIAYIVFQASRGEPSHFNVSTPFHAMAYSVMGFGAVVLVSACLWIGVVVLFCHRHMLTPYVLAVGIGLILTFALGGGFGGYLGGSSGHWVGGAQTDAGGLPLFNWVRDGGDLRVAHFFGMHAMQIIPLFGWWLHNAMGRRAATGGVIVGSALYAAFCSFTFMQALQGKPFL